ncbi:hypothetical protein EYF80_032258 [Liparis tanakae]|uniref:Uncharacterized protein n=1 Tax=Liparis tanakae TaxID=230148 RepID=A0A4Z2GY53_9TELE|nr:hypothetical protein EYF80_032258 [Liparis tanakae]
MKLVDRFTPLTATGAAGSPRVTALSYTCALFDCLAEKKTPRVHLMTLIHGEYELENWNSEQRRLFLRVHVDPSSTRGQRSPAYLQLTEVVFLLSACFTVMMFQILLPISSNSLHLPLATPTSSIPHSLHLVLVPVSPVAHSLHADAHESAERQPKRKVAG